MPNRKISTLPDVAVLGDLVGTQVSILDDLVASKTKQVTLALLRRALFAGGTGYTGTDPLTAGNATLARLIPSGASLPFGSDAAAGTNTAATSVTFDAPLSRGNATPAALIYRVGVQGASGSTLQTATEAFRVQEIANRGSREVTLWNQNGTVMGRIPSGADPNLFVSDDGGRFNVRFRVYRAASAPSIASLRFNGTYAVPTQVLNGNDVLNVQAAGWTDAGAPLVVAAITATMRENLTATTAGAQWTVAAADVGGAAAKNLMTFRGGGATFAEILSVQATLRLIPGSTAIAFRDSTNAADTFTVNAAGTTITAPLATTFTVGTDPGGSALFRVGGTARLSGGLRVGGGVAMGQDPLPNDVGFWIDSAYLLSASTSYGMLFQPTIQSTVSTYRLFEGRVRTAAASFTVSAAHGFFVRTPVLGSGSAITSTFGIEIEAQTVATTNQWGLRIGNVSGASTVNRAIETGTGEVRFGDVVNINTAAGLQVQSNKVIGARKTGWGVPTGTLTRTTFDSGTVTLPQLAERVAALINDLHSSGASSPTHALLTT